MVLISVNENNVLGCVGTIKPDTRPLICSVVKHLRVHAEPRTGLCEKQSKISEVHKQSVLEFELPNTYIIMPIYNSLFNNAFPH